MTHRDEREDLRTRFVSRCGLDGALRFLAALADARETQALSPWQIEQWEAFAAAEGLSIPARYEALGPLFAGARLRLERDEFVTGAERYAGSPLIEDVPVEWLLAAWRENDAYRAHLKWGMTSTLARTGSFASYTAHAAVLSTGLSSDEVLELYRQLRATCARPAAEWRESFCAAFGGHAEAVDAIEALERVERAPS